MLRISLIALGAMTFFPVHAWTQATVTTFTLTETVNFGPMSPRQTGQVTHLFGQHNVNTLDGFVGSEADKLKVVGIDGVGVHDANFDAHLQFSPEGLPLKGTLSLRESLILPGDGIEGHWECAGGGTFTDGNFESRATCQGTGDLEGQTLFVRALNDHWDGTILVPSATGVAAVPEPTPVTLAAMAMCGIVTFRRRRGACTC